MTLERKSVVILNTELNKSKEIYSDYTGNWAVVSEKKQKNKRVVRVRSGDEENQNTQFNHRTEKSGNRIA